MDREKVGNWTIGKKNVMPFMLTKHSGDSREPGLSSTVKYFPEKDGSSQGLVLFYTPQGLTFCSCQFGWLVVFILVNYKNALAILK